MWGTDTAVRCDYYSSKPAPAFAHAVRLCLFFWGVQAAVLAACITAAGPLERARHNAKVGRCQNSRNRHKKKKEHKSSEWVSKEGRKCSASDPTCHLKAGRLPCHCCTNNTTNYDKLPPEKIKEDQSVAAVIE